MLEVSSSSEVEVDSDWEKAFTSAALGCNKNSVAFLWSCDAIGCGKTFKSRSDFEEHRIREHVFTREAVVVLEDAKASTGQTKAVKTLVDKESEDGIKISPGQLKGPFRCDHEGCAAKFRKHSHYLQHLRAHSDERPFKCGQCDRSYKRGDHLSRHVRSAHQDNVNDDEDAATRWACSSCPATFSSSQALTKHEKKAHLNLSRLECLTCGKTFHKRNHLSAHQAKEHEGKLPHACPECPRRFVTPQKLRRHLEGHSRRCSHEGCQQVCRTFSELRRHVADAHPKFECPTCPKAFNLRRQLEMHQMTHQADGTKTETTVFQCPHDGCDR